MAGQKVQHFANKHSNISLTERDKQNFAESVEKATEMSCHKIFLKKFLLEQQSTYG